MPIFPILIPGFIMFAITFAIIVVVIIKVAKGAIGGIKHIAKEQKNFNHQQAADIAVCEYCSTSQSTSNHKCTSCGARLPK